MILKMLVPPSEAYEVDGTHGTQLVIALVEDDSNEYVCVIDQFHGTYHLMQLIDKSAIFKFSHHNMARIEIDEVWDAINKYLFDQGLGVVLDGMRLSNTGSLSK